MSRPITLLTLIVLLVLCAGNSAAQTPDPMYDLEEKFMGCRPGCDFADYQFGVRNTSGTYDYVIRITGTPMLDDPERVDCCGGDACENYFTGEELTLEAAGCVAARYMNTPQFPNCTPLSCSCDNEIINNECVPNPFCATIYDPKVVVTKWRVAGDVEWQQYSQPIVLCQGTGKGKGRRVIPACTVEKYCTGYHPYPCPTEFLCM
jgi:hypothetical protein